MKLGNSLMCCVASAVLLSLPAPLLAQETSLRAAVFVPTNTIFGELFGRFVEHVNQEGKGLVQIRLVGGPDAVPSFEQANAVRTGVLDMAAVPPAYYVGVMPEADAQILSPLSFKQQRQSSGYEALNKLANQKINAWYLASYGDGIAFHIYTTKPVQGEGLQGFQGMKLRTTPNYTPLFQTLGVALVTTPPGELQTALERGVVDGYGWPLLGVFDLGWGSATKYRIEPGFYNVVVNVIVNLNKWKSLRDDQRAFLTKMGEWLETENTRWAAEKKAAELKRQNDAGIKVIDLGSGFRKRAYDAYWAELTKRAPEAIATVRPLLDRQP